MSFFRLSATLFSAVGFVLALLDWRVYTLLVSLVFLLSVMLLMLENNGDSGAKVVSEVAPPLRYLEDLLVKPLPVELPAKPQPSRTNGYEEYQKAKRDSALSEFQRKLREAQEDSESGVTR